MLHELKILPEYFEAVASGEKKFEVRYDDRGYQAGDELILREIDNDGNYTGQRIRVYVTYVYRGEYCKRGYCIMSIEPCPMRVNYEGDGYDDDGNLIYDTAYCPNCGRKYEVDYDYHDDYCRNCGQALDWSFEEAMTNEIQS